MAAQEGLLTRGRDRARLGLAAVAISSLAVGLSCSSGSDDSAGAKAPLGQEVDRESPAKGSESSGGGLLFVLSSESGRADGSTVTLSGADGWVTVFTDRPGRSASRVTLEEFVSGWAGYGFESDPPNASVTLDAGGVDQSVVVELSDPTLSAEVPGEVSFSYRVIDEADSVGADADSKPGELPAEFNRPDLFIDNGGVAAPMATALADQGGSKLGLSMVSLGTTQMIVRLTPEPNMDLAREGTLDAFRSQHGFAALVPADLGYSAGDLTDPTTIREALGKVMDLYYDGSLPKGSWNTGKLCMGPEGCSLAFEQTVTDDTTYNVIATATPPDASQRIDPQTQLVSVYTFST
ncbi:MAG: hypothetical protein ACK5O2_15870 [Microthrixaceae bacterium]